MNTTESMTFMQISDLKILYEDNHIIVVEKERPRSLDLPAQAWTVLPVAKY